MKKIFTISVCLSLLILTGCNDSSVAQTETSTPSTTSTTITQEIEEISLGEGFLIENLLTYTSVSYENSPTGATTFVDAEDILISESGVYEFTGEYNTITVNMDKTTDEGIVYLVLNNATISSDAGTPINIVEAKNVVILLADNSENAIIQGSITTNDIEFPTAAIYSRADTLITGNGTLMVETLYQDGINSRDDLIIEGATIVINAFEDGIVGKDLLQITDSDITIVCGKDGLKSSNDSDEDKGNILISGGNYNIFTENDAISSDNNLQIDGGTFNLESGGGYTEIEIDYSTDFRGGGGGTETVDEIDDGLPSTKGIKAKGNIVITDGEFYISSLDDGIHGNQIMINGGIIEILTCDDGIHADLHLQINGGDITIVDCYEGLEAILSIEINGGNIDISSLDDSINASDGKLGEIRINGGTIKFHYYGPGGDGFDANGDYIQTGGNIIIVNTNVGTNTAGAFDIHGEITKTGGTIIDGNGNDVDITTFIRSGEKNTVGTDAATNSRTGETTRNDETMTAGRNMTNANEINSTILTKDAEKVQENRELTTR